MPIYRCLFLRRSLGNGPEFLEDLGAVADAAGRRRIYEREAGHVAQSQGRHAQDDLGQVAPQDLGRREERPCQVVLLAKEADAHAVFHPPAAPLALVGTAARDRLYRQGRGARARIVLRNAGQPGVDHVADARNRQRRLGHVGGDDDLAAGRRLEDQRLPVGRQPRKKRQDPVAGGAVALQNLAGLADVLLGRHEDQDIAERPPASQVADRGHRAFHRRRFFGRFPGCGRRVVGIRIVNDLHGIQAPGHLDHRGVVEGARKLFGVDRGRGDDQLEIATLL